MPQVKFVHPLFGQVVFDAPSLKPSSPITFVSGFTIADVTTLHIPQLKSIPGGTGGTIRFHRRGHAQLLAAFDEIEARGLMGNVKKFDGAFNPRLINPQKNPKPKKVKTPSNHSFGIAVDINAFANELVLNAPLAPIFDAYGFRWGKSFNDPMHFEVKTFIDHPKPLTSAARLLRNGLEVAVPIVNSEGHVWVDIKAFQTTFGGAFTTHGNTARILPPAGGKRDLQFKVLFGVPFGLLTLVSGFYDLTLEWNNVNKTANLV